MADPEDEPPDRDGDAELPDEILERARELTQLEREAVDENERQAYREEREALLAEHDYDARVREDDTGETLVLHPTEWTDDGVIRVEAVEDTDRALELSLSGPGSGDDWDEIDAHNREVARQVRERHGEVHGANAEAFADFMSNHYAKTVEAATEAERREFRTEYVPRNAWPTEEQRAVLEESLQFVMDAANGE